MRIFKTFALLGVVALVSACAAQQRLPFAAFAPEAEQPKSKKARVGQVDLAGGDLKVVAPDGFCVSKKGLKKRAKGSFVLIGECGALGQDGQAFGSPRAFMTVTTLPQLADYEPNVDDVVAAVPDGEMLRSLNEHGVPLALISGTTPLFDGMSSDHWRGAFTLNGHIVLMSFYGAEDSGALAEQGSGYLQNLADSTRAASADIELAEPKVRRGDGERRLMGRIVGVLRPKG